MLKRVSIATGVLLVAAIIAAFWLRGAVEQRTPGAYFDSAGLQVFYTDEGPREADPVILVHGFAVNGDINWRANGIVSALNQDFRVITIDNRGHGLSGKPHEPEKYGIEMVNDIVRLMDHLKIPKAHVVGYSMGAFITMRLIASYPDRLLSAMPCGAGWSKPEGSNIEMLNGLADSLDRDEGFDALARHIEPEGKDPGAVRIASMNYFLSRINDKKALAAVVRGFKSLVVEEAELRTNKVPVKSVVGSRDPLRDGVDNMKDVMANLETVYLEGDDHITAMRDKQFIANIRDFLAAHRQAKPSVAAQAAPALTPALAGN